MLIHEVKQENGNNCLRENQFVVELFSLNRVQADMRYALIIFGLLNVFLGYSQTLKVLGSEYYTQEKLQPFINYLEAEGYQVQFNHANSLKELESYFIQDTIDIAFLNPFSNAIVAKSNQHLIAPLVVPYDADGKMLTYHSAIITNAKNQDLAMENMVKHASNYQFLFAYPSSTSGHLFPRLELNAVGIDLPERYFKDVSFTGSHADVIQMVANNQQFVGACSFEDIGLLANDQLIQANDIKVLWQSVPIPAGVIVTDQDNSDAKVTQLRELIKKMPRSPNWKAVKSIWGALHPSQFKAPSEDFYHTILDKVEEGLDMIYFISHYNEKLMVQQKELMLGEEQLNSLQIKIGEKESELSEKVLIIDNQKTVNTILIIGLIVFLILIVLIVKNYRTIKANAEELEEKNATIIKHRTYLQKLNNEVSYKNQQLEESIAYAYEIQQSLFPDNKVWQEKLEYELITCPLAKVSGDFAWFKSINENENIIVLADCTGHGVPGAMLSMLGIHILDTIAINEQAFSLKDFIEQLQIGISQVDKNAHHAIQEGMELIAVHVIHNPEKTIVNYHSIGLTGVVKAVGKPSEELIKNKQNLIFGQRSEEEVEVHQIVTDQEETLLYLFSDGLTDQKIDGNSKLNRKGVMSKINHTNSGSVMINAKFWTTLLEKQIAIHEQRDDISLLILKLR